MSVVTGPTSAAARPRLTEWDEAAVQSWLADIGIGQYENEIFEHGITGEVLRLIDNESLQDMGMKSMGHRLTVLRSVYELKREQGIEIGDDEWRPQEVIDQGPSEVERLSDIIIEMHERLHLLEKEHMALLKALGNHGLIQPPSSLPSNGHSSMPLSKIRINPLTSASVPAPPLTSDSSTFNDSFTPTTTSGAYPFDSPQPPARKEPPSRLGSSAPPPSSSRNQVGISTSSGSVGEGAFHPSSSMGSSSRSQPPPPGGPLPASPVAHGLSGTTTTTSSSAAESAGIDGGNGSMTDPAAADRVRSKAKDAAHSAAKSFRVTMEDPCWKVLPAALKKYKINDDWKMYALFICFGNTERCLSYDEKPLLLFQKLKENGQKPVFMLRHIRDIKSPIAVAQQKQALKLGLPPNSSQNLLPSLKPSDGASPTKSRLLPIPGARQEGEGHTPSGGAFPELPSPGIKDGEGAPKSGGAPGTLVDKDGNVQKVTYAISIYPYVADRQDEFDVAVGATFIVLSKAKGWWIVQKDPDGTGDVVPDTTRSGWVPAGCLLELSEPILSSPRSTPDAAVPGRSPLAPTSIMSSSYPGIVLMDYVAKGDDELSLKEGDKVRVYKKYCHWSYSIKQETGERGWVPAWFIGKSSTESQPGSAIPTTASSGATAAAKTNATNTGLNSSSTLPGSAASMASDLASSLGGGSQAGSGVMGLAPAAHIDDRRTGGGGGGGNGETGEEGIGGYSLH